MPARRGFARATPLEVLEEIAPAIVRSLDAAEIVDTVARLTRRVIDYDNFRLYRWERASESLVLAKSVARARPYQRRRWLEGAQRIALGQGITGRAARTRRTVLVRDAGRDRRVYYPPGAERLEESVLCVPMVAGDELVGVMSLAKLGAGSLGSAERRLMEAVAAQTALALLNAERFAEAERTIGILAALDQSQREFILVASHELRGPLGVISGYASMFEEGSFGQVSGDGRLALRVIGAKAAEMQTMVERMLQVARLEEGLDRVDLRDLDLGRLALEAVERIAPVVDLGGGTVSIELPPEPALGRADAKALALVLDNLLQNAAKFSLGAPAITVRVRAAPLEVEVADRGPGIPPEAQLRLFEKFFRADHPELRHVGGTGLGLYLVRRLVEGMGGAVAVRSRVGHGTAFVVTLPGGAAARSAARAPAPR